MPVVSVGMPLGPGCSTCGYCGPLGERSSTETSFKKAGFIASQLSCEVYQKMIYRGWRRSGTYCYAPDLRRSCCPQYTIRLDAIAFKPSRSQRKLINRWNHFVMQGHKSETSDSLLLQGISSSPMPTRPSKSGGNASKRDPPAFSLSTSIHAAESDFISPNTTARHNFKVTLEPSTYSEEKYTLYLLYQRQIHHDPHNTPEDFKRFLVKSPLINEPIPYPASAPDHLPSQYGSFHQMYRLDGELIAVGVIDILPECVSSVYFMYDPKHDKYSLGKLSALREASLAREMHDAGAIAMSSLAMGFYIHSCPKMKYKGGFSPSYLADPEEFTWVPLADCIPQLEKFRYAAFVHPEHSLEGPQDPGEGPPVRVPEELLNEVMVIYSMQQGAISIIPISLSHQWKDEHNREEILSCVDTLGDELSREIIFR
ncbi:arginine-tRNA-protein transferase [Suillus subalutaceus]|uniref:arginine-tRNA-protein transferase n=1 Tax=Suillus subalutaceus TaxID=48586 RepID=UPI001B884B50|nr:arginine-tRNA-protein transferase [Suillus subalutaceus]KAG1874557.1 arginine-tRNA-protein transferase [Suillus subalutaceus]